MASLTNSELRLMSLRGHQGYLAGNVPNVGKVVGRVDSEKEFYESAYASIVGVDGSVHRVRRIDLSSASVAEVESALEAVIANRLAKRTEPAERFRIPSNKVMGAFRASGVKTGRASNRLKSGS